jgi:hypothetical protein
MHPYLAELLAHRAGWALVTVGLTLTGSST